jgi:hypothetical protein
MLHTSARVNKYTDVRELNPAFDLVVDPGSETVKLFYLRIARCELWPRPVKEADIALEGIRALVEIVHRDAL